MGVFDLTWDNSMVEAALFRSTGVALPNMVYGPATNPNPSAGFRHYKNAKKGTGVGHTYQHVQGTSDEGLVSGRTDKSRYADKQTMVAVIVEILNSTKGKNALKELDDNPSKSDGIWLRGSTAIIVTGSWYGYAANETTRRKIKTVSINMRAHGDALFITSSYPEEFQALTVFTFNLNAPAFIPSTLR